MCTFSAIPSRRFRGVVQGDRLGQQTSGWRDGGRAAGRAADAQLGAPGQPFSGSRPRLEQQDAERPFRMGTTAVVTILGFPDKPTSATSAR